MANLYQKILQVSSEVRNVEKNTVVGAGTSVSYKAVSDLDVVLAVKAAEEKYKVISIPVRQELVDTQIVETTTVYKGVEQKKTQYADIIKMTVRIIDVEKPEDFIEVEAYGRGLDPGDKGFGKASTYARKYCLLNAYKIATGADPDKDASEEGVSKTRTRRNAPNPAPDAQGGTTVQPDLKTALARLNAVQTAEQLTAVYNNDLPNFRSTSQYLVAYNTKFNELKSKGIIK